MYKVSCKTNIDDVVCNHIEYLTIPPRVGDYVTVRKNGKDLDLKIVKVTHKQFKNITERTPALFIEIELNK